MGKIIHHVFYTIIAYLALAASMLPAMDWERMSQESGVMMTRGTVMLTAVLGMAVFLAAVGSIHTYDFRASLRGKNRFFWGKEKIRFALKALCILLAVAALFMCIQNLQLRMAVGTMTEEELADQSEATINVICLYLGCWYLWIMCLNLILVGANSKFTKTLWTFIRSFLPVFLAYRAGTFVLTLAASMLMARGETQSSYLMFVLGDSLVESISTGVYSASDNFLGDITGASSYYLLITVAEEYLTGKGGATFKARFRRMFFSNDSVKMMAMALFFCLFSAFAHGGSLFDRFLSALCLPLWLISTILFLADTKAIPYLIGFAVMGFAERLLPVPEAAGFLPFLQGLGMSLLRVLAFSVVALLAAYYNLTRQVLGESTERRGKRYLINRFFSFTLMDLCSALDYATGFGSFLKELFFPVVREEDDYQLAVHYARKADAYLTKLLSRWIVEDE